MQTKLMLNKPGDEYEHEADCVSDEVVRMPESQLDGESCPKYQTLHRGHNHARSHAQRVESHDLTETAVPKVVSEVLASPGQPLDSSARAFMESRFGHDFSGVRVHNDARAAQSAQVVNARAFTVGQDLVFNHGQYEPSTRDGRGLLAHELTHVSQQSEAGQPPRMVQRQTTGSGTSLGSPAASATVFHPGVNHDHKPSGRWADVQANPNSSFWANRACANFSPRAVVGIAIRQEFSDKPLGLEHLTWYLGNGQGADFVEDTHLDRMLRTDAGVQALLAAQIPSTAPASGTFTGHTAVEQGHYQNQDFRFAFGAIDRLDFQVNFKADAVHAWFQDRYEWHPVYPGLYAAKSGDDVRETNCVHAALVELKSGGSADFWMKGEATVPLSLIRSGAAASGGTGGAGTGESGL